MNKKIYIIGIEGAGTSALAQAYKHLGYDVSGSDNGDHFYRDVLRKNDINSFDNFDKNNVPEKVDFVIRSTAFQEDNPEIQEVQKRNYKLIDYPEALGMLFQDKVGISVCGTHGKTTTSAMLAQAMFDAGKDPMAIIGSKVVQWGGNTLLGSGEYFIAESDEYQNKLRYYNPWAVVLTSVDWDHPDFFPTVNEYKKVFRDFVEKIPSAGLLVACGDDSEVLEVIQNTRCKVLKYGYDQENDYIIEKSKTNNAVNNSVKQNFKVSLKGKAIGSYELRFPGKHNALNATAVISLTDHLNFDTDKVRNSLSDFKGTARRFQYIGERNGAILFDDYAHHPEEIKATLSAAREIYPNKEIICVFHPHTYSRTKALLSDFSQSFGDADQVIVLDIFGSSREKEGGVTSAELVSMINKFQSGKSINISTIEEAITFLKDKISKENVLISMGAGDVWRLTLELVKNQT